MSDILEQSRDADRREAHRRDFERVGTVATIAAILEAGDRAAGHAEETKQYVTRARALYRETIKQVAEAGI